MSYNTFNPVIKDGLVLYLDSNNLKSYTSGVNWNDLTSNNINGILENGLNINNNISSFDGVDDYVSFTNINIFDGGTPHTYSVWIKIQNGDGYKWVLNNGGNSDGSSLIIMNNKLAFFYGGGDAVLQSDTLLDNGVWYSLTISYLGEKTVKMYVNGQLDSIKLTDIPTYGVPLETWSVGTSTIKIGSWYSTEYPFSGCISICNIYNRDLSSDEILHNYNALKNRFL